MFLAIDECLRGSKKIIGGVLSPNDEVSTIEKEFTDLRIKHKLFGEIKWNHISGRYVDRYCEFIDIFFNKPTVTYHSICYSGSKYPAAYTLIRNITWKLFNAGIKEPINILFDNDGELGNIETKKIREFANNDSRFRLKIDFCSQGTSHVLGILQLADLLTGSINSEANKIILNNGNSVFYNYVKQKNGSNLTFDSSTLPKLNDYKIHYLDPNNIPQIPTKITEMPFDGLIKVPTGTNIKSLLELNNLLKKNVGLKKIGIILPSGKLIGVPYLIKYDDALVVNINKIFKLF